MSSDWTMDELDRKILARLVEDARTPFSKLAEDFNVSPGTIHGRFDKLVAQGIVKGSRLILDRSKVGYPITAYIGVSVAPTRFRSVTQELLKHEVVTEIHVATGIYSFLIRAFARSVEDLDQFLENIQFIEGIQSTQTFVVLKTHVEREIDPEIDK